MDAPDTALDADNASRPGESAEHGAKSRWENFPATGKRQLCLVSQGHAPAEPRLCRRAPVPTKKGLCSRQALSRSLLCPTNGQVAARSDRAAYQLEGGDVKYGNTGNPTEMLRNTKLPSECLASPLPHPE